MNLENFSKNNKGFTLVELLVSMAIFVTSVVAISTLFSYSNRTQMSTKVISEVQSDARFAIEVISQHIRRSSIYYNSAQYGGEISSNPVEVLVLEDLSGDFVWFRKGVCGGVGCVEMSEDGLSWSSLTPPGVSVNLLKFYISPSTDPFSDNPSSNQQPKVTVVMSTSANNAQGGSVAPFYIQTTVSSRQYLR